MTNAEARFNNSLRPRKPEGSLGRTAQDVHLDSYTAHKLCVVSHPGLLPFIQDNSISGSVYSFLDSRHNYPEQRVALKNGLNQPFGFKDDTSRKAVEREHLKQLSATPLNSLHQDQT